MSQLSQVLTSTAGKENIHWAFSAAAVKLLPVVSHKEVTSLCALTWILFWGHSCLCFQWETTVSLYVCPACAVMLYNRLRECLMQIPTKDWLLHKDAVLSRTSFYVFPFNKLKRSVLGTNAHIFGGLSWCKGNEFWNSETGSGFCGSAKQVWLDCYHFHSIFTDVYRLTSVSAAVGEDSSMQTCIVLYCREPGTARCSPSAKHSQGFENLHHQNFPLNLKT